MKKLPQYLQKERDRIKKLSGAEYVAECRQVKLEVEKTEIKQMADLVEHAKKFDILLAFATDEQLLALAKNSIKERLAEMPKEAIALILQENFQQRRASCQDIGFEELGLEIPAEPSSEVYIEMATRIRDVARAERELKENPEGFVGKGPEGNIYKM
jgi:hypothetical protein